MIETPLFPFLEDKSTNHAKVTGFGDSEYEAKQHLMQNIDNLTKNLKTLKNQLNEEKRLPQTISKRLLALNRYLRTFKYD